jgi:hypothetical protein
MSSHDPLLQEWLSELVPPKAGLSWLARHASPDGHRDVAGRLERLVLDFLGG